MPKKAQAAQAQGSGKVETTAPGTGDQATNTSQAGNSSTATGDTAGTSSNQDSGNQVGTSLATTNQPELTNNTPATGDTAGASSNQDTGSSSAPGSDTLLEVSHAMGGTLMGTQLVGESVEELRLAPSTLAPAGHASSSESGSSDAAAGTGESFAKMLADSFRSTHGLKVTSGQAGFRRAGRAWSTTPTVIALSDLSDDDVRLLKAEPMLSVELVDLDDDGEEF